jgi:hypothetical protein
MTSGPSVLAAHDDNWITDVGAWFPGERVVYRGRDLFSECADFSWFKLLALGILGRELNERELELYEAVWVICTSFPEPRLWNNRIAALAGTTKSTAALAIGAATAVSEAKTYGRRADIRASTFLHQLRDHLQQGGDLGQFVDAELKKSRSLPGFGRPVTKKDERLAPLLKKVHELGFDDGYFFNLTHAVQRYLDENRMRLKMNIAIITAGLFADIGFTPREYYVCAVLSFSAGMFPCYMDASSREEGVFLPLGTERLRYTGHSNRAWRHSLEEDLD